MKRSKRFKSRSKPTGPLSGKKSQTWKKKEKLTKWGRVPRLPCWVVLLSFRSFGCGLRSPSLLMGGAAWFPLFFGGDAVSPFLLRFAALLRLLWVLAAFTLSSFAWCCFPFPSFGVGLRSPSLRLGGAAWSPPPSGGVAFPISFQVVLPSTFSSTSVGWCCLVSCFFGWCCCPK